MATATKSKPKQKQEEVTFLSRYRNMRYVVIPVDTERNHQGRVIRKLPGKDIRFDVREFTTSDEEEIEFLRKHPDYGVNLWEKDHPAPGEPEPTFTQQQDRIMQALAERDSDAIRKIVEEENKTHKRESVLRTAEGALSALVGGTDNGADAA